MSAPSNSPAPTPGLALPPGMTLDEFMVLQGKLVTISICVACAFAIIFWDYVITFKDEWSLYMGSTSSLWKQPSTWAFIVLRYAALVATITSLFFTSLQSSNCSFTVHFSSLMIVVVVAAAGCIFSYRVLALWNGNYVVYGIVGFFYFGMVACWLAVGVNYDASTGPPTPFNSNCQLHAIVSWNPISFASSVVFDMVVLVLTMLKLRAAGSRSPVHQQLYNDNLAYFVITTATNLAVLVVNSLPDDPYALVKPAAEPFATVVVVTMATRTYLNLKLLYQRQARGSRSDGLLSGAVDSVPPSFHMTKVEPHGHEYGPTPYTPAPPMFFTRETNVTSESDA